MNSTIKTLSVLTVAAAALAATVGSSSALTRGELLNATHGGAFKQLLPNEGKPFKVPPFLANGGHLIPCFVCIPHPTPSQPPNKDPGHGWGGDGWHHGFGWNRWHYGYGRPEIIVEGQPPAAAGGGAAAMPVSGRVASAPSQTAAEPCNCLTKQNMPDGSVLFQDICTKESAIAPPETVGSR